MTALCRAWFLRLGLLLLASASLGAVGCAGSGPGDTNGGVGGAGGEATTSAGGGQPGSGVDAGSGQGGARLAIDAGSGLDARGDVGGVDTGRTAAGGNRAPGTGGAPAIDASAGLGGRSGVGDAGVDGARAGLGGAGGPLPPVTIYIAGDSTVSDYPPNAANMQAGWGQLLPDSFTAQVTVSNQAIGGRTSRRFIEEGRLTAILNTMKVGDYLMVQFGTNDGNTVTLYPDGEPYLVSTTDFQGFMMQFITGARGRGGIPILVTPPPRRSCTGDSHTFGNGLAGYAAAMKTVATQTGAALVDLNGKTLAYLDMIGCIASGDFFLLGDGTHFQLNGARIMAGFVADGVRELALPLAAYEK